MTRSPSTLPDLTHAIRGVANALREGADLNVAAALDDMAEQIAPRAVATVEEVDALPIGSVLVDEFACAWQSKETFDNYVVWWRADGSREWWKSTALVRERKALTLVHVSDLPVDYVLDEDKQISDPDLFDVADRAAHAEAQRTRPGGR